MYAQIHIMYLVHYKIICNITLTICHTTGLKYFEQCYSKKVHNKSLRKVSLMRNNLLS